MAILKTISGIRGTIGGTYRDNLTPLDIVECVSSYAHLIKDKSGKSNPTIVTGRDARISGENVSQLAIQTLIACGLDVIDLGLSTTPTVEMAVKRHGAQGGIVFTASHNQKDWNALKFLNQDGEFISAADGQQILKDLETKAWNFAPVESLGKVTQSKDDIQDHIDKIFNLPYVDSSNVQAKHYKVAIDCINSTAAISIIPLLEQMGCEVIAINAEMHGDFAHNPEPLPKHLEDLCNTVKSTGADLGIAVDPDVDRLAFVNEDGVFIGEELTLVLAADYLLPILGGNTVSNLSSTRALSDIAKKHNTEYHASAVGEVNVVSKMKETKARIGGEGNGGVILADLHYGRDALVGTALILTHMAQSGKTLGQLADEIPAYYIVKNKIQLDDKIDYESIISNLSDVFSQEKLTTVDGLKIDFAAGWVHLRKSNTEPIIRVYAESSSKELADQLVQKVLNYVTPS